MRRTCALVDSAGHTLLCIEGAMRPFASWVFCTEVQAQAPYLRVRERRRQTLPHGAWAGGGLHTSASGTSAACVGTCTSFVPMCMWTKATHARLAEYFDCTSEKLRS